MSDVAGRLIHASSPALRCGYGPSLAFGSLRASLAALALLWAAGCSFDTKEPAPEVPPPSRQGVCASTATLLPRFLAFLEADRFAPIREVIEDRLLPSAENPSPDPSLRTVLKALVSLVRQLGLDKTAYVVHLASRAEIESQLGPLVQLLLELVDGRLDGVPKYEVTGAGAYFIATCNPNHLLLATEEILRLESPSHQRPWLAALLDEVGPLLADPTLEPFLESFERNAETGRPAIVSLLVQIFSFLADRDFAIERVETLLESAVYPVIDRALEEKLRRLVILLEEATRPDAGVLLPLQESVRCGMRHPAERDVLIGFTYDLVSSQRVGLDALLGGAGVLALEPISSELSLFADIVRVIRTDLTLRDDLRALLVLFLGEEAPRVVPVLIDLIAERIVGELLTGVVTLLSECEG